MLFDNNTFAAIQVEEDRRKFWKVSHDAPVNQKEINAYLLPQGSIAAITDCNSVHLPAIHAHGMTGEKSVPRIVTKLDVRLTSLALSK